MHPGTTVVGAMAMVMVVGKEMEIGMERVAAVTGRLPTPAKAEQAAGAAPPPSQA